MRHQLMSELVPDQLMRHQLPVEQPGDISAESVSCHLAASWTARSPGSPGSPGVTSGRPKRTGSICQQGRREALGRTGSGWRAKPVTGWWLR
jgi:hypothetical protein